MTLDALIMFAGAFVAVLPFLGFPNSWNAVFFTLAGIFIIGLGIAVRRRESHRQGPPKDHEFTQSVPFSAREHEDAT